MSTITPAYGRDYTSAKQAKRDWHDGKDFILRDITSRWDGKPCSIRDFSYGANLFIRYNNLQDLVAVTGK
jgi:hypothetical protein